MIEKIYPKFGCKFRHEEIIALLKIIQKAKGDVKNENNNV